MTARHKGNRFSLASILAFGAAIGALGVFFGATPFGRDFEQVFGLDFLFELRGPRAAPPGAVVLAIEEQIARPYSRASSDGAGDHWDRRQLSTLIDLLLDLDVSVIAVNLFLKEPGSANEDELLRESIARADRVVLHQDLVRERGGTVAVDPLATFRDRAAALGSFVVPTLPARADFFWPYFRVDEVRASDAGPGRTRRVMPRRNSISLPLAALHVHAERVAGIAAGETTTGDPPATPVGRFLAAADALIAAAKPRDAPPSSGEVFVDNLARVDAVLAGRLRAAYASPGVRYLNYYGPAATVPTVSYRTLAEAARDDLLGRYEWMAGNVVFVGYFPTTAAAQVGRYETVYIDSDGLDLSGVEIAATAFLNIRHGDSLVRPVPAHRTLLVFLFGFSVGAIVLGFRPVVALAGVTLFGLAGLSIAAWQFYANATWLPIAVPFGVQLPAAVFWGMVWQYRRARRERNLYRQGLEVYVPHGAVDQLEQRGAVSAQSERVYATCLFADIADYTTRSESVPAFELTRLINEYFALLGDCVRDHGGEVFSAQGDEILAVWSGADEERAPRARACECALAMATRVAEFNRTREAQPIFTRFGMHAGWLERGVIGGGGRFSYNVVGDIVNTAKRIESLNKTLGTQILATREVVEGLDEFLLRPVGRFRVKGKHQPVEVAEIVCRRLEANGQQVALCQTFEAVVNAFRVNDHQSVREELERIRNISSADGPADFYLKLVDGTHRDLVVDRFGTILLDGTGRAPIPRYGNSD